MGGCCRLITIARKRGLADCGRVGSVRRMHTDDVYCRAKRPQLDRVRNALTQGISDFDAGLLLTLDALLKDQNVTHAAARLNITQSALSARLTRLRQLLSDPLFIPAASGRGMIPTPHATALQPELARLIERFTDFVNTAHLFDLATSKRVFRIAATDNPAAILAPDLIPLVKSQAPNVRIAFTLPDKSKIADHLEQGGIDLFVGTVEDAAPVWSVQPCLKRSSLRRKDAATREGTGR